MLLTKTMKIKWCNSTKKYYEEKGYKFTGKGNEFEVKIEDLVKGSNQEVEVECDSCNSVKSIMWSRYIDRVENDGKYYCGKCALKLNKRKKRIKTEKDNDIRIRNLQMRYKTDVVYSNPDLREIGIYLITCTINNKVYVGQTKSVGGFNKRWNSHLRNLNSNNHENNYLQNAWNKHGEENFVFKILEIIKITNRDDEKLIDEREKHWVKEYKSNDRSFGYNITEGGDGALGIYGENNKRSFLTNVQVEDIKISLVNGISYKKLAEIYNVELYIIREIKNLGTYKTIREDLNEFLLKENRNVRGERTGTATLTNEQVYEIKKRLSTGESMSELALEYNKPKGTIQSIKSLVNWKYVGEEFNNILINMRRVTIVPSKLLDEEIINVRKLYKQGKITKSQLAKQFNVSKYIIDMIIQYKNAYSLRENEEYIDFLKLNDVI